MLARLPDGSWSSPCMLSVTGVATGLQLGVSCVQSVTLLNSTEAVSQFQSNASLRFGANLSAAVGPRGRDLDGDLVMGEAGTLAAAYSYSFTSGLYAGVSLGACTIVPYIRGNLDYYEKPTTVNSIMDGSVTAPTTCRYLSKLMEVLASAGTVQQAVGTASVNDTIESLEGVLQNAHLFLAMTTTDELVRQHHHHLTH